ncbi:hypothetical protein [Streptosporangium jomthongense]|uniref:Uncharacterized protein n=1 Tax=Streptosporangium jomthongense TaxID=1193683 RepID=A0ABV8FEV1_9ACTN
MAALPESRAGDAGSSTEPSRVGEVLSSTGACFASASFGVNRCHDRLGDERGGYGEDGGHVPLADSALGVVGVILVG